MITDNRTSIELEMIRRMANGQREEIKTQVKNKEMTDEAAWEELYELRQWIKKRFRELTS